MAVGARNATCAVRGWAAPQGLDNWQEMVSDLLNTQEMVSDLLNTLGGSQKENWGLFSEEDNLDEEVMAPQVQFLS